MTIGIDAVTFREAVIPDIDIGSAPGIERNFIHEPRPSHSGRKPRRPVHQGLETLRLTRQFSGREAIHFQCTPQSREITIGMWRVNRELVAPRSSTPTDEANGEIENYADDHPAGMKRPRGPSIGLIGNCEEELIHTF